MAVLCPRCGEYSSITDEHCKKCGFSIKNYLDNKKRLGKEGLVGNEINGSSSICLKEKESINRDNMTSLEKSEEIQQNIMRLLSNIKIVPSDGDAKEEENDKLAKRENALSKKEHVKIIAKKVADDVIIFPPNRVKVEIEAAKNVVKETSSHTIEDDNTLDNSIDDNIAEIKDIVENTNELSDEIVGDRIKKIKEELEQNREFINKLEDMGMRKEECFESIHSEEEEKAEFKEVNLPEFKSNNTSDDYVKSSKHTSVGSNEIEEDAQETDEERKAREEKEAREAEIHARAIPSTESYSFREFVKEHRENNISKNATLIIGGAILVLILIIALLSFSATAAMR